jgi:hypothetical protein
MTFPNPVPNVIKSHFLTQYVHSIDDSTLIGLIVLLFHSYVSIDSKPNWIYLQLMPHFRPHQKAGNKPDQMCGVLASNKVN